MNNKNETNEEMIIEKDRLVAYLSLSGIHCQPFLQDNGRVAFKCLGRVTEVLADLQGNPRVRLLDYMQRLDSVRQLIFSLKDHGRRS